MSDELQKSINSIEVALDKYFEINENSTLHEIALSLEYHNRKSDNRRMWELFDRVEKIENKLYKIEKMIRENNINAII